MYTSQRSWSATTSKSGSWSTRFHFIRLQNRAPTSQHLGTFPPQHSMAVAPYQIKFWIGKMQILQNNRSSICSYKLCALCISMQHNCVCSTCRRMFWHFLLECQMKKQNVLSTIVVTKSKFDIECLINPDLIFVHCGYISRKSVAKFEFQEWPESHNLFFVKMIIDIITKSWNIIDFHRGDGRLPSRINSKCAGGGHVGGLGLLGGFGWGTSIQRPVLAPWSCTQ